MTEYSDLPAVNALYAENEQVNNAVALIDAGGALSSFNIAPPPDQSMGAFMMGASITVPPGPPNPDLMAAVRQALVDRSNAIEAELSNYGVTAAPPARE